jgi:hypothetical protein
MMSADLFDPAGTKIGTAVLHKGKITIRTEDHALEQRLIAFFHAPDTMWKDGEKRTEMAGSEAHFEARCRGLHRHGLTAVLMGN